MFGEVLPIAEVLPIELDEYVTFEWIGESDHLDEAQGMARKRGSRATSADAAIRYRAIDGGQFVREAPAEGYLCRDRPGAV